MAESNIREFPTPSWRWVQIFIDNQPALGAVADYLPSTNHPKRQQCEKALYELFRRQLSFGLKASLEQAREWLKGADNSETVIKDEFARMKSDDLTKGIYLIWREALWLGEADPFVHEQVRHYTALLWRLYRLDVLRHVEH